MREYTPRRASARWLEGAPDNVLDVFDSKGPGERYTVLFTGDLLTQYPRTGPRAYANTYVQFLGMDDSPTHPQGISMWGELHAYQAAAFRYRCGKQRVRWLDLPEHIRNHVIARSQE